MKQKIMNHYKKHSRYFVAFEDGLVMNTRHEDEYNKVIKEGFLNIRHCLYWSCFLGY